MKTEEIDFVIDTFTPETMPMFRLATYMREFAALLGSEEHVHFSRIKKGSTRLAARPEYQAVPKVMMRLDDVLAGLAPRLAMKAHHDLDVLLAEDNAIGHIEVAGSKRIEFPGRRRPAAERIGPVRRSASVEGQIYQIGGKDETINVHLRGKGGEVRAEVTIELARSLAPHLLSGMVRLFGVGDWYRINSRWERMSFTATDFITLDRQTLTETLRDINVIFSGVSPEDFMATMEELRQE